MTQVISLVPSWTETLLWADVPVIGRTRYCIHPKGKIRAIPIIGGTKSVEWPLTSNCQYVIIDKEENTLHMAEASPYPTLITHVQSLPCLAKDLRKLATHLESPKLYELSQECHTLCNPSVKKPVEELPGVIEWVQRPRKKIKTLLYLIWRNPWMCVSQETFIGDMLSTLGYGHLLPSFSKKYPCIDLKTYNPETTLLLCASEPFPFHKKTKELAKLPFPSAVVSGECYSWFGVRAIQFLKSCL